MITWGGFAVLGCTCSFCFRFPGFGFLTILFCSVYGAVIWSAYSVTGLDLLLALVLATASLQLGYLAGVVMRITVRFRRYEKGTTRERRPELT